MKPLGGGTLLEEVPHLGAGFEDLYPGPTPCSLSLWFLGVDENVINPLSAPDTILSLPVAFPATMRLRPSAP